MKENGRMTTDTGSGGDPALVNPFHSVRIARLRDYLREHIPGQVVAEFARRVERPSTQLHDMLKGERAFGEKLARDFEKRLRLPTYWFDVSYMPEAETMALAENLDRLPPARRELVRNYIEYQMHLSQTETLPLSNPAPEERSLPRVVGGDRRVGKPDRRR